MKRKNWGRALLRTLVLGVLCLAAPAMAADVVSTDVSTAASGNVLLGLEGKYVTDIDAAIELVNGYRQEACREGVINPSTGSPLTLEDYVPIQWSGDLEYIARIRAAESLLTMAHTRTNGDGCFNIASPNGINSFGEVLAWNYTSSMLMGITQWYREKSDWVNKTGGVTGHYTQMIDPSNKYMGLATFCSDEGYYYNCTAGQFSGPYYSTLNSTRLANPGEVIQLLEIPESAITSYELTGETTGQGGDTLTYRLTPEVKMNSGEVSMIIPSDVTWASSDTSIATITNTGILHVVGCGKMTIFASWNGATDKLEFTSNHIWDNGKITTEAHCETAGVKTYTCKTCQETRTEAVPATGHKFDEGKVTTPAGCEKNGVLTYTCINTYCNETKATKTEVIPATGHSWDSGKVTTEATCGKDGVRTITCTNENCSDTRATKTEVIPATKDHTWDAGKVTVKATTEKKGKRVYTCTVCKQTKNETIAKLARKGTTVNSKANNAVFRFTTNTQLEYVKPINAKKTKVTIPATVKVSGKSYKVTSIAASALKNNKKIKTLDIGKNVTKIGKNAFYGCSKLKTVTIRTTKLKTGSIGKKAFSKIYTKAVVKVPKSKLSAYKKLLKTAGLSSKASVKK